MGKLFEVKLRPIGNSLGAIFPKNAIEENQLRNGETVAIAVLKKKTVKLEDLFGTIKGAKPFKREHKDRVF